MLFSLRKTPSNLCHIYLFFVYMADWKKDYQTFDLDGALKFQ